MRGIRWLTLVLVAAAGIFVPFNSAHATGGLEVPDGVLYDQCVDYKFTVSAAPPPGYTYEVSASVTAYGPDGLKASSDFFELPRGQSSGSGAFFFCGDELVGSYTASGELSACDSNYNCVDMTLGPDTFTLRLPQTRTTLKVSTKHPRLGSVVRLTATTEDERPAGFFRSEYCYLWFEKKVGNRWVRLKGSKTFVAGGQLVKRYTFDVKKGVTRAVRGSDGDAVGSVSRPITITSHPPHA